MKSLHARRAVAVLREPVFSPGMVEHDAAILRAAAGELARRHGIACPVLTVSELAALEPAPELVISMAEGDDSLAVLEQLEQRGTVVINAPSGVRATRREALLALARPSGPLVEGTLVETRARGDIAPAIVAAIRASGSAWVKRADYHALGPGDVARVDASQLAPTLQAMHARGIERAVVQPHLAGPVVKFYAVAHARPFFRAFPMEGAPRPSPRELQLLEARAFEAAHAAGITVFGGDAVLAPGAESPVLIDLNAWPSFWRCLADAATAIADHAASHVGSFTSRVA